MFYFEKTIKVVILLIIISFFINNLKLKAGEIEAENIITLYNASGDYSGEMYFPPGSSAAYIRMQNANISKEQSKRIIRNRIDRYWEVIINYIPFPSKIKAYAFMLGHSTLESTLNPALETAYTPNWCMNPAHAYGLIQTAETAFLNNCSGWMPEYVPDFPQAPLRDIYFVDPVVSMDMGLRKLCWFAFQAQQEMRTKKPEFANATLSDFRCSADFWMLMLKGFNTGWATYDIYENGVWRINDGWVNFYGTWVPATAKFYFYENHIYDDVWTWHTDQRCNTYLNNLYIWLCETPATITYTETKTRTPMWTITTTYTRTLSSTPTLSPSPSLSRTQTITYTRTPAISPIPTNSRSPIITYTITRSLTLTLSRTPTITYTRTLTLTNTRTSTTTSTSTCSLTRTTSPTFTRTVTITVTSSQVVSVTRTTTRTVTSTSTRTATAVWTGTATRTNTPQATNTYTGTATRTNTTVITNTFTATQTGTPSFTRTVTGTYTRTTTSTGTNTSIATNTFTVTQIRTGTPTYSRTKTSTNTFASTSTRTNTQVITNTFTETMTSTQVESVTFTRTVTQTSTYTRTNTPTNTPTSTLTRTSTSIPTFSQTVTSSQQLTIGNVIIFPNPYSLSKHGQGLKFMNVVFNTKIIIYTISGEYVIAINCNDITESWDLINYKNRIVSPGIYFYIIRDQTNHKLHSGKIFITN